MPRSNSYVPDNAWDQFKNIINHFVDNDAGKQPFLWLRYIEQGLPYGEDSDRLYEPVKLDGLFHYNYIKSWPTNSERVSGELDLTNIVLYISANLLKQGEYLDKYGYWDYNWSEDRFILNGKVYKPGGDTQVAQAKDTPLLFFVILYREDPQESQAILNAYAPENFITLDSRGKTVTQVKGKQIKDLI